MFEKLINMIPVWAGSSVSIVVHTLFFIGIFSLVLVGVDLDTLLLVLTTAVSLEAIYLALFIQRSVNLNTATLVEVGEDIEGIEEDIEEISEDVGEIETEMKEIGDDIEGIEKDIDELEEDVEDISEDIDEVGKDLDGIEGDLDELQEGSGGGRPAAIGKLESDVAELKQLLQSMMTTLEAARETQRTTKRAVGKIQAIEAAREDERLAGE